MLAEHEWSGSSPQYVRLSATDEAKLLQQYGHLVKRAAAHLRSLLGSAVDKDDLQQVGLLGLLTAIRRYGKELDQQFEAYAFKRVRGAMLDEFRKLDWRPRLLRQQAHQLRDATRELQRRLGRPATDDELCQHLAISLDELLELQYVAQAEAMESFEQLLQHHTDEQVGSANLADFELKLSLEKVMSTLPERSKLILQLYYTYELNMKEIALVLKLTESRVCQLHRQSIELVSKKLAQW